MKLFNTNKNTETGKACQEYFPFALYT